MLIKLCSVKNVTGLRQEGRGWGGCTPTSSQVTKRKGEREKENRNYRKSEKKKGHCGVGLWVFTKATTQEISGERKR